MTSLYCLTILAAVIHQQLQQRGQSSDTEPVPPLQMIPLGQHGDALAEQHDKACLDNRTGKRISVHQGAAVHE